MMKETGSIYAYKVEHTKDFSFKTMMKLASDFVNNLDKEQINELFEQLKRGVDLLSTEPQMNMYLYAYGKMHEAKLKLAFENMGENYKQMNNFAIVDYGCGQGLASIVLYDHLKALGLEKNVHKVVLIEPSEAALKRAALHVSKAFPKAEIVTVNKFLDNLTKEDITCENMMVFHLFSNILDVESVSLKHLSNIVNTTNSKHKKIICVSPNFGGLERNRRIDIFCAKLVGKKSYSCDKLKGEWKNDWSCKVRVYSESTLKPKSEFTFKPTTKPQEDNLHTEILSRNPMTIQELMEKQQADVDFFISKSTGKLYFGCGNIDRGYCSPAVEKLYKEDKLTEDSVKFVECSTDGGKTWIPCIMLNTNKKTIVKKWSREDMIEEELSTEATKEELVEAWEDEFGVKYSKDGKKLLKGNIELEKYDIREGTTVICDNAFRHILYSVRINHVKIPNTVKIIGNYAFAGCSCLTSLDCPDSLEKIGEGAFSFCKSLQFVKLSNSLKTLENNIFQGCKSLETIVINSSILSIGNNVFCDCGSLQSVDLPRNIRLIGDEVFANCSSIKQLSIPDSVTKIGDGLFNGCSLRLSILNTEYYDDGTCLFESSTNSIVCCYRNDVIEYQIPQNIKHIANKAFKDCSSLRKIELPESLESIGSESFNNCKSLRHINIPSSVCSIGERAFKNCKKIVNISIPNNIEDIKEGTFSGCTHLRKVDLPETLKSIEKDAFWYCGMFEITFPVSLINIEDEEAFFDCEHLIRINIPANTRNRYEKLLPTFKNILKEFNK